VKPEEPPGPPPYELPEEIAKLPPLDAAQLERVKEVYSKTDPGAWGFEASPAQVTAVLNDLKLVVDDKASKMYLERAFPGRDLSWGLKQKDCEILYQVALDALPLQSLPAKIEKASLEDVHTQEGKLRKVFSSYAGPSGAVKVEDVPAVLAGIGVTDSETYTPRFVNKFTSSKGPGPVKFPEIVDLCNATVDHMLTTSPSPASASSKQLRSRASSLARKGADLKSCAMTYSSTAPFGGKSLGGSLAKPTPGLRRKNSFVDFAAAGSSVVLSCSGKPMPRSSSTGALRRY